MHQLVQWNGTFVCLKIGYTPTYGYWIRLLWKKWWLSIWFGIPHFQTNPYTLNYVYMDMVQLVTVNIGLIDCEKGQTSRLQQTFQTVSTNSSDTRNWTDFGYSGGSHLSWFIHIHPHSFTINIWNWLEACEFIILSGSLRFHTPHIGVRTPRTGAGASRLHSKGNLENF